MRRKPDRRVVGVRLEPIGQGWDRRIAVLECGHTREAVVPAKTVRANLEELLTSTRLQHCYECSRHKESAQSP